MWHESGAGRPIPGSCSMRSATGGLFTAERLPCCIEAAGHIVCHRPGWLRSKIPITLAAASSSRRRRRSKSARYTRRRVASYLDGAPPVQLLVAFGHEPLRGCAAFDLVSVAFRRGWALPGWQRRCRQRGRDPRAVRARRMFRRAIGKSGILAAGWALRARPSISRAACGGPRQRRESIAERLAGLPASRSTSPAVHKPKHYRLQLGPEGPRCRPAIRRAAKEAGAY